MFPNQRITRILQLTCTKCLNYYYKTIKNTFVTYTIEFNKYKINHHYYFIIIIFDNNAI